jgi:hypothetical protein
MRRDLKALVESRLGDSRLVAHGVFRPEAIARLLEEHMGGRVDHSYRLWLLLNLEIWHEIYIDGRSPQLLREEIRALDPHRHGIGASAEAPGQAG